MLVVTFGCDQDSPPLRTTLQALSCTGCCGWKLLRRSLDLDWMAQVKEGAQAQMSVLMASVPALSISQPRTVRRRGAGVARAHVVPLQSRVCDRVEEAAALEDIRRSVPDFILGSWIFKATTHSKLAHSIWGYHRIGHILITLSLLEHGISRDNRPR